MGMVKIQAIMMLRATPHFTVLVPMVEPTPMMDEQITCVVLTGIPAGGGTEDRCSPGSFRGKTVHRAEFVDLYPMVLTIRHPPERVPRAIVV